MPKSLPKTTWNVEEPTPQMIQQLIKQNPRANLSKGLESWQLIASALKTKGLDNPWSVCAAAATAAVETCHTFLPLKEIGNNAYFVKNYWDDIETRRSLGNSSSAAAIFYCGRGVIQLTGQANYTQCGKDIGVDLFNHPERALEPGVSAAIFCWFWSTRHLADISAMAGNSQSKSAGRLRIWQQVRRTVNGPKMNGFDSYYQALKLFGAA